MKKNYLRFGLVYCVLALLIFSVLISFYTKKKVDELNSSFRNSFIFPEFMLANTTGQDRGDTMRRVIGTWDILSSYGEDIGFYSSVVDTTDGRTMFESGNFLELRYYGEFEYEVIEDSEERYETESTQLAPGDVRYMFFDEPLELSRDEYLDLSIPYDNDVVVAGARCDDTFISGGTLTFTADNKTRTVKISEPELFNEEISVPYEDWIVELNEIDYYSLGGSGRINNKAHKLSDGYVVKYLNGEMSAGTNIKAGLFTSTISAIYVFDKGNYLITYYLVMNPFKMVIRDHVGVYILSVLALVIVEAVIIYAVRKLYLNQKRFELRSEKLTKGIAYDLKGPLSVTKKYLDNWENADEDKRSEYSEKIISEVDHMSSMVTRLLELSKLHDGSVKLNREDVDLLLLTNNLKKRNMEMILEKKIDFTIECDEAEDAFPVYADLEMMYIVVNNFMTNAIKYCDHSIKIRLKKYRNSVEFSITNDGAKIDKEDLDKVWDALYISGKGKSETDENSGVGLSVVKSILDAHNAKYGCYSGAKGTNFWFMMDEYEEA